jgi:hypothetical protein
MRALLLLLALLPIAAGCSDATSPASGQSDLTGGWSFSYVAIDTTSCGIPGLVQGSSGGGTLDLVQVGPQVTGSWAMRGGFQTCGGAGDFLSSGKLRSAWSWRTLEFGFQGCEFRADLPSDAVDAVSGTVRCSLGTSQVAQGTWRMTRQP